MPILALFSIAFLETTLDRNAERGMSRWEVSNLEPLLAPGLAGHYRRDVGRLSLMDLSLFGQAEAGQPPRLQY